MPSELTVHAEDRGGMERRGEHPAVITHIDLAFTLCGASVDEEAVRRALTLTEEQLCPVWAMVSPGTPVETSLSLVEA